MGKPHIKSITLSTFALLVFINMAACNSNGQLLLNSLLTTGINQVNSSFDTIATAVVTEIGDEISDGLFPDDPEPVPEDNGLPTASFGIDEIVIRDGDQENKVLVQFSRDILDPITFTLSLNAESKDPIEIELVPREGDASIAEVIGLSNQSVPGLNAFVPPSEMTEITGATIFVSIESGADQITNFTIPVSGSLTLMNPA